MEIRISVYLARENIVKDIDLDILHGKITVGSLKVEQ